MWFQIERILSTLNMVLSTTKLTISAIISVNGLVGDYLRKQLYLNAL